MQLINLILHLDAYLIQAIHTYHNYFYMLLFLVIFLETGIVVLPFLPGDSLLFIAGGIASNNIIDIRILSLTVIIAAFIGDNTNFFIGKFLGHKLFKNQNSKIFRKDLLSKTNTFYRKHGGKTVIIARFIPFIRTFAPFIAGIAQMKYFHFIAFSIVGSFLWVLLFIGGGYLFGNIPWIKSHLFILVLTVIILSLIPMFKVLIDEIRKT